MFDCLGNLLILRMDRNLIFTIHNNAFSNLHRILHLSMNNVGPGIKLLPDSLNIRSLQRLDFTDNNYHFDYYESKFLKSLFSNLTNLRQLYLSKNILPGKDIAFKVIFESMPLLNSLFLKHSKLIKVSGTMFSSLKQLSTLDLSGNNFGDWTNGTQVFGKLKYLRKLYLNANNINIVNKSSIPFELMPNLSMISFANNPFMCSCAQKWFVDWLRNVDLL